MREFEAKSKFARDWRNRHIGHRDLALVLRENAKPLKAASRQKVKEAIGAIATVLNAVESHYCGRPVAYEFLVGASGNADTLLYVLKKGIEARDRYPWLDPAS